MFGRVRKSWAGFVKALRDETEAGRDAHSHNLFEAAAAYVSACAEDDQDRIDDAMAGSRPRPCRSG